MVANGASFHRRSRKIGPSCPGDGMYQQIKSNWTVRSSSAESDLIFVPKTGPVTDVTVALNLNGIRLISIVDGSRMLVRGKDYTVSSDYQKVTFAAAVLTRLVGDIRDLGRLSSSWRR